MATREMLQTMRQRVLDMETQRAQHNVHMAELRRNSDSLRQQYAHLQASINERATRGEVSASIQATIGPVRSQVESALQHYSEGLATATATAAAAAHAANDARRRTISNRMTVNTSYHSNGGDPETTMEMDGRNGGGGGSHDSLMNSIDIIEARVERRMLRSIEDKIELEMSRANERGNVALSFDGQGGGDGDGGKSSGKSSGVSSAIFQEWQLELERKVQEGFQRVLEMGGKLAEESQRRHLAISAARAETRMEGKRIDELTATVIVAEREMRMVTEGGGEEEEEEEEEGGSKSSMSGMNAEKIQHVVDQSLQKFLSSSDFLNGVKLVIEEEVKKRVEIEMNRIGKEVDVTSSKLELSNQERLDRFEIQWSSKFDFGMKSNESEM